MWPVSLIIFELARRSYGRYTAAPQPQTARLFSLVARFCGGFGNQSNFHRQVPFLLLPNEFHVAAARNACD
jgi:hypothetical protein